MASFSVECTPEEAAHVLAFYGEGGYPAGHFVQALLAAMSKADRNNLARFKPGFPGYFSAVLCAKYSEDGLLRIRDVYETKYKREAAMRGTAGEAAMTDIRRDERGSLWIGGYLCEQTGICNCDGGEFGHRPLCGWEPVADTQALTQDPHGRSSVPVPPDGADS